PDGIRTGSHISRLILHIKVTVSEESFEFCGKGAHCDLLAELRASSDHDLPVGKHPCFFLLPEMLHPQPHCFRMECAAILKIVDQRRNGHCPPVADLAVPDSCFKFIAVVFCSLHTAALLC